MSTDIVKQLIGEHRRISSLKDSDPQKDENMLFYVSRERDLYRLINEQFRQIIQTKSEESQELKTRLFKFEEQSKKLIKEAEIEWRKENSKSANEELTYIQQLQNEKEEKIVALEVLIKEGKELEENQRKQMLEIHDKGFTDINLKKKEIYSSVPCKHKRTKSQEDIVESKMVSEGVKFRQMKKIKKIGSHSNAIKLLTNISKQNQPK